MANLQLTWSGFETAVDLIVAQSSRHCSGVYGESAVGKFLAVAVAYRLEVPVLDGPAFKMLVTEGVANDEELHDRYLSHSAQVWVWIDQSINKTYNSVITVDRTANIFMPWEDAFGPCSETFISGFHD